MYVCRDNGRPHTIIGLLHALIQTLINISHGGIQLLSTSTYLPLAKVCRLYYIGRCIRFTRFTPLLTHQLSCRSPQNSLKVQIKVLHNTLKKHFNFSSNIFYLLSRHLPLALTREGNAYSAVKIYHIIEFLVLIE